MLAMLRGRTKWRGALGVLALLALAIKVMAPPGYMPGSSLAAPIMLCPGQGAMPGMAMAHERDHAPATSRHDMADHSCAFAGLGLASLAVPLDHPDLAPIAAEPLAAAAPGGAVTPGRGLAAPPPPSRAPPAFRA